jgi:hypothetical protein
MQRASKICISDSEMHGGIQTRDAVNTATTVEDVNLMHVTGEESGCVATSGSVGGSVRLGSIAASISRSPLKSRPGSSPACADSQRMKVIQEQAPGARQAT